ncbi:MAG: dUTP diphosphatase [Clostridiales bacterium]|nr:dUTP diphosphatase [Clostridiales bacterium]
MEEVEIFVEKCRENVELPQYANYGDAGMDICAAEDITIKPGETVVIPTGIKLAIPVGYEIQVRPRSGISLKNPLRIPNSPGTIDSGYRDELGIIMANISNINEGTFRIGEKGNKQGVYEIKKGDRVAQIVLQKVPVIKFVQVDSVKEIGQDRKGGYGSTGV